MERNRWSSKEPSFKVSDWIERYRADGFDGIELWENHYLRSDRVEQAKLAASTFPVNVYNSYAGFTDDTACARKTMADAIITLKAQAVKYNLGSDPGRMDEYRRNLLEWANKLPTGCRLLCECHQGSILETAEAAADFHKDMDPAKFGMIIHPGPDRSDISAWFNKCGPRISHLHMQLRTPETDPSTTAGRKMIDACVANVKKHSFTGGLTIEFTRGIGKTEEINTIYANACADMNYIRSIF
jgi:sugar phosphate isomerase/epimerase